MAVVAQRADVGAEVLGVAGPLNGGPHGHGPPALAADGLLRRRRRNGDGLAQVEQADLGRGTPEQALAQERVGLDAAHAAPLEAFRRRPPGLVVHDDQVAVGRHVEPVDDAAQAHAVDHGLDAQLNPHRPRLVGVLQAEVVVDQRAGVGQEGVGLVRSERQLHVLLVVLELVPAARRARPAAAAGVRAPGEWCQKSPSSAACTRVPLTAWGDGGSGRCSICEKRKASGQLVKATTFDGLRVRGRSSAIRQDTAGE